MINQEQKNIADQLPEDVKETLGKCFNSTAYFSRFFSPETFYTPFNSLHDQMFELLDSDHKKVVIAAPRGLGKTSILVHGLITRMIVFGLCRFVVYISNSATAASLHTENLKHELLANNLLRNVFGNIKTQRYDDFEERFSTEAWVTHTGTMVVPRGMGQQVRGLEYHSARPDLIIFDDLENKKNLKSEDMRSQNEDWFFSDPMKCVSRYDDNWRFVYIDTLKHEGSIIQKLINSSDWKGIRLEACDDNLNPTAEAYMDRAEIIAEHKEHKEKGKLDVFYREYRNLPISTEDASFKPEYFRYYEDGGAWVHPINAKETDERRKFTTTERISTKELTHVVIVDPAKTVKMQSAESAIVGVGIHRTSSKIFVRDIIHDKLYPDQIYRRAGRMAVRLNAFLMGVEVTGLNEFIVQPFNIALRKARVNVRLLELTTGRVSKEERISGLVPYYRQGFVYHNPTNCQALESQLITFPSSALWDIMDALSYIVRIMDEELITFEDSGMDELDDEKIYLEVMDEPYQEYALY